MCGSGWQGGKMALGYSNLGVPLASSNYGVDANSAYENYRNIASASTSNAAQSGGNKNSTKPLEASMGISISGSNAISGLSGNDTDFDKVLENLKKIESTQLNKLESWKADWKLRYDAFTEIIEQIQAASSMLSQLSDKNSFVTKNVTSSNEHILTAVANASAQDVQHTINVKQTASNAIWANTAHVFSAKDEIINTSNTTQKFEGTYGGKKFSFDVPPKTNLESFQSMINNSAENPGIRISLLQTGNGYLMQVSGKETGVANDLQIYDSNLVGMQATGSTNTWMTNNTIDYKSKPDNPTAFVFDIVTNTGKKHSLTIKGNVTADELIAKINNLGGVTASVDASGQLTLTGAQSFTRRESTQDAYKEASISIELGDPTGSAKLKDHPNFAGLQDSDEVEFTINMADGTTRTAKVKGDATIKETYAALAQAASSAGSGEIGLSGGKWSMNIPGVASIVTSNGYTVPQNSRAATGTQTTLTGVNLQKIDTILTFDKNKLTDRLDGKAAGDPATKLTYTVLDKDGNAHYITVDSDMTNENFANKLAADLNGAGGMTVAKSTEADGTVKITFGGAKDFWLSDGKQAAAYTRSVDAVTTVSAPTPSATPNAGDLFYVPAGGAFNATTSTLEKAPDLVYTVRTNDGKVGTLTLPAGTNMQNIVGKLRNTGAAEWSWTDDSGNPVTKPATLGVTYTDKDGKEYLKPDGSTMTLNEIGDQPVYLNFKNIQSVEGPGITGQVSASSNWNIQRAANAVYTVDNWPVEMESTTNTISDSIEGVVVSIQEVGEARISVSTDITSVEQSIQNFLDAVNSVLVTVNNLMKYDESKEVTSNDPEDIGNSNYSPSGLTNQKGNLLTGNYGVQLFKSRFSNCITSTPPGFQSRQTADDVLSGDFLASLANLGIKTDTDTTSDTYGLLVLAPSSGIAAMQDLDKENYNDMITNHLEAVVDFFCTSGTGSSTTTDFRYASHVAGITKAGTYEVTYDVAADGTITNVMVGGQQAVRDGDMPGNYYTVAGGDPGGLAILIDNLEPGSHSGEVRIKEGLVQTVNSFLKAELVFNDVNISSNSTPSQIADAVHLKSQNGALMSLRDNYMKVMEGIDAKIEREQRRIDTWYTRQKTVFANLETLLNSYSEKQKTLESQLKQLSSGS